MAGYLGTKAVFLSTTASSVTGNASVGGDFTVDTNTLHVDSTNNRVGVGTASPTAELSVNDTSTYSAGVNGGSITLSGLDASSVNRDFGQISGLSVGNNTGDVSIQALNAGTMSEAIRVRYNGNVGIGTSSPQAPLEASVSQTSDYEVARFSNGALGSSFNAGAHITIGRPDIPRNLKLGIIGNGSSEFDGYLYCTETGGALKFGTQNTERMRLDRFGQLLINTTDAAPRNFTGGTYGTKIYQGQPEFGLATMYINRSATSDGDIIVFRKEGTTVGSIGYQAAGFEIDGEAAHTGILFTSNAWRPKYNGSVSDNFVDLGASSVRFDDVYATNGTIQTSDANEKQQISSLTDAEMQAAKAISALFKTFKWNDKVAEKGDAARKHTGVIAQDVQQAMADAGLDAGDYAFFISNTWWETQTEVPAVEAVAAQDAVYDEEGNLISEAVDAVEAQEAYTRTDTYDTLEEAPEGATERTRLGIRYPELLAFIGAATEQRLASIEARLDALEGV